MKEFITYLGFMATIFMAAVFVIGMYDVVNSREIVPPIQPVYLEISSVFHTDTFYLGSEEEGYSISCETEGHIATFSDLQSALNALHLLHYTEEEDYRVETYIDVIEGRYIPKALRIKI